ncbi:MAG: TonB-dependent receptor, partial [Brevundimonas sp.]
FSDRTLDIRGDAYGYSEGEGVSTDFGATLNLPITDTLAFRASVDQLNDQGFIDMPYLVREIGVSDPNPDFSDPADVAANLYRKDDVNTEDVTSGRAAVRWNPSDWFDATLSYNFQDADVGGRQVSGRRATNFPVPVGDYEAIQRVEEPNKRETDLWALEGVVDLGFAELTSATGYSTFKEDGQRDQSDLLYSLEYSYEAFPSFTAYTQELEDDETFTQELRLTSKPSDSPFSWIVGGFYSKTDFWASSAEYTPHIDEYFGGSRPDALEYYAVDYGTSEETAFFGEVTWQFTPAFQITGGARHYTYDLEAYSAVDLPLFESVFNGRDPDSIVLDFGESTDSDDGWLYKLNASYKFSDDLMMYATISDGFRTGGSNGAGPCPPDFEPDGSSPTQIVCALPNELIYGSETTRNYEIGVKSQWLDNRLTFNAAVFFIEWSDPQVASATVYGLQPITKNADGAETKGVELSYNFQITDNWLVRGSYSYAEATLTETTVNLVPYLQDPCPTDENGDPIGKINYCTAFEDGQPGDRLPGSPKSQFSFYTEYDLPLSNGWDVNFSYSLSSITDVLSRTGGRGDSITLPGFTLSNIAVRLTNPGSDWTVTGYVDNLFDTFAETGVRGSRGNNRFILGDENGDPVYPRSVFTNVIPPRVIGVRFTKAFGL